MTSNDGPPRSSAQPYDLPDPSFAVRGRRELGLTRRGGPVADALQRSVDRMSATGANADAAYQEALAAVRSQPAAAVGQLVSETLRELPEEAYLDRWLLVQVLTDVRSGELVDALRDVITTPLPPERAADTDHKFSTRGREVIIRTTAVEGVARLAAQGSAEAVECLLDNVTHENHTVRAACIAALYELGGEAAARVRERVADEDRALLESRRMSVYDVPQPDTGADVRYPGAHDDPPPPPPTAS